MEKDGNLHAGHRERVLNRFLANPDAFSEHERLEVLLFFFLPRKNTNELAHKLLRAFGSLDKILTASTEQLLAVDGVGKSVASSLVLLGMLAKTFKNCEKPCPTLNSFFAIKEWIGDYFAHADKETFVIILLDKNRKLITSINFSDQHKASVSAEIPEIAKAFALHRPSHAIIAHNHPSNIVSPSIADDITTKKINLLCAAHGVTLDDHVIIGKDNAYSYCGDGKLAKIKESSDLIKILNGQGE